MPTYDEFPVQTVKWGHLYHPCEEQIPYDVPTSRGKLVKTTMFYDANLLFDFVTGRSETGIIHLLNKTPIDWFCKKQNTVETSTFGSEFNAARIAVEQILEIRTTLRYLGIPIEGPSVMFGDNQPVVNSSMDSSFRLKKRHNMMAFHRVREEVACGIVILYHIRSEENPADILTKQQTSRDWYRLMKPLIFNDDDGDDAISKKTEGSVT